MPEDSAVPPPGAPLTPRAGWHFLTALGIGQIVTWGCFFYTFPLIAEAMGRELGYAKPALYGAATLGITVSAAAAYPVGALIDRGYGRTVLVSGCTLGGAVLLGWSAVHTLAPFYALFAAMGLVHALTLYEPAFAIVARRYGARARVGITALTLWGGFASTVFVPVTQALLDGVGWRGALRALGVLILVAAVPLHAWSIDARLDPPHAPASPDAGTPQGGRAVRWALRQPVFWGLLATLTLHSLLSVGLIFHLYPLLLERGLSAVQVVSALALIGPAQVLGRLAIWFLARERSVRAIGVVTTMGFPAVLALLVLLPPSFASAAAFALLFGAVNGVMTIVRGVAVPELLTRESYGAINGVLALPSNLARGLAPAAMALIWATRGSYTPVLLVAIGIGLLCAFAFAYAARGARS